MTAQPDLFASASGLSVKDQAHLNAVCRAVADGRLTDAHIAAMLGSSETTDGDVRDRFDRLATALLDAKDWISAWATIARLRGAA